MGHRDVRTSSNSRHVRRWAEPTLRAVTSHSATCRAGPLTDQSGLRRLGGDWPLLTLSGHFSVTHPLDGATICTTLGVMIRPFSFLVAACLGLASAVAAPATTVSLWPGQCAPGLHKQPHGPFAVLLFCEDALGNHLGVIYLQNMSAPSDRSWSLTDRFWQKPEWGADVTSYAWDDSGQLLFVSTSAIYGSGEVHVLDLGARTSTKLFPKAKNDPLLRKLHQVCVTELLSVDSAKREVDFLLSDCDLKTEIRGSASY